MGHILHADLFSGKGHQNQRLVERVTFYMQSWSVKRVLLETLGTDISLSGLPGILHFDDIQPFRK